MKDDNVVHRPVFRDLDNQIDGLKHLYYSKVEPIEYGELVSVGNLFNHSSRVVGYFEDVPDPLKFVVKDALIGVQIELQSETCKELGSSDGYKYFFKGVGPSGNIVTIYPRSEIVVGEKEVGALLRSEGLSTKEFVKSQWSQWE